jgi:hypothetical protein
MDRPSAFESDVEMVRLIDGVRIEDASPYVAALESPSGAARGRENEHLFILLWLTGHPTRPRYRELREMVTRTYWATTGSITAALRRATATANHHLFQRNLRLAPSDRCYGGLSCAVLHDEDLFILQAGPGGAFIRQGAHHEIFPPRERLAHLGIGPLADARLHHVFISIGDTLLLTSPSLPRQAGVETIIQTLSQAGIPKIISTLEQMGTEGNITALAMRIIQPGTPPPSPPPAEQVKVKPKGKGKRERKKKGKEKEKEQKSSRPAQEEPSPPPDGIETTPQTIWRERLGASLQASGRLAKRAFRRAGRNLTALARGGRAVGSGLIDGGKRVLQALSRGIRFVGYGLFAVVSWSVSALGVLIRRMLPGVGVKSGEHQSRGKTRRAPPEENRMVMMGIAIAIPILVAILVVLSYVRFRRTSRSHDLITGAEREIEAVQSTGDDTESARSHWQTALNLASQAVELQPHNPTPAAMLAQAQAAMDEIDQVTRVSPTQVFDFGSSNADRKLIFHSNTLFVIDPTDDWVAQLPSDIPGGNVEIQDEGYLVQDGDQIGGSPVGDLVDCTWVEQANGRRSSALVMLTSNGDIISFDPSWNTEGNPDRIRSALGDPPQAPQALSSYQGRLYILDVPDDEEGQIWRYSPNGDAYTEAPEPYFKQSPSRPLTGTVDMAIDGHIYLLYNDGTVLKFLGGVEESFQIHGVPDGVGKDITIAVDPQTANETVYLADRAGERVIVLGPDGAFQKQFRAEGSFDGMEALAVDESNGRFYVLNKGIVYEMSLQ